MKNKKILKGNNFILPFFVLSLIFAGVAYGATCDPSVPTFCNPLNLSGAGTGVKTIGDALIIVIKFLLSFVGIISLLYIIIAGVKYMISSGNEEKITSAKNTLTSAIEGLALSLIAYGIVTALEKVLTVKS